MLAIFFLDSHLVNIHTRTFKFTYTYKCTRTQANLHTYMHTYAPDSALPPEPLPAAIETEGVLVELLLWVVVVVVVEVYVWKGMMGVMVRREASQHMRSSRVAMD